MGVPSELKCSIHSLANELLEQIYDLCSTNERLCLKMCCRTLRDNTPGTARELYRDISRTVDFGNVRFERLCMDDNYTHSTHQKLVCSLCRQLHPLSAFTPPEIPKPPTSRVCEPSQRLLDLTPRTVFGPGISFTCEQLLLSRNLPLPLPLPYDQGFTFLPLDSPTRQWTLLLTWTFPLPYPLPNTWITDLRALLESFPVCTCPHRTSSDPILIRAIIAHYRNCLVAPPFITCPACDTRIEFTLPTSQLFIEIPPPGVSFRVARRIGMVGESAVDKRWKAQSLPAPAGGDVEGGSGEGLGLGRNTARQDGEESPCDGTCCMSGGE
ncbi:hypothetical protein BDR22DRAFT_816733 [Usnea florida]